MGMEIIIIIIGLILDRITKLWAINKLSSDIVIIKGLFSFSYLENRGAAFGILQHKIILLSVVTLTIIIGIIYYLVVKKPTSKWLRVSFSLIISGAFGNLFDRVYYRYVVDFILFHYKDKYYFPTFNVADIMVVVGTIMLGYFILFDKENV
jgi:signal peptidase II